MRTSPHDSIGWALSAWSLRDNYLPLRTPTDIRIVYAMTEAAVFVTVFELLREIELSLKAKLRRHFEAHFGSNWWNALPQRVKENAATRHRWSVLQLGQRQSGAANQIAWLSFGDVLKTLRALPAKEWKACLSAETMRRRDFEKKLARIKSFRDHELAHPKPARMTNHNIRLLSTAILALPGILCPNEWARVLKLLTIVSAIPSEDQQRLVNEIDMHLRDSRPLIRKWLACPTLDPPEKCSHTTLIRQVEIKWRESVLFNCARLDSGRRLFFSYGEPLSFST